MVIGQLAVVDGICWYGHTLRRLVDFKADGQRRHGRSKVIMVGQVEEESLKVESSNVDALCRSRRALALIILTPG